MKNYAVIVAGGSGNRMQSEQPKQFLELNGRPVLMHTLDAFYQYDSEMVIILVLPSNHTSTWQTLITQYNYKTPHQTTIGGSSRFDSVKNGLNLINENGIVAIHDGARPLITPEVIQRSVTQAKERGNGIAAVQLKDSIRKVVDDQNKAVNRSQYYAVQTPQTFRVDLIKEAFSNAVSNTFTDDASVLESYGEEIVLVEGSYDNLKITTPEDLVIATSILNGRK